MSNFKIGNYNVPKRRKSRLGKRLSGNANPGLSLSNYWKTPRSLGKSKFQTADCSFENQEPRELNAVKKCLFKKSRKETLDFTATDLSSNTPRVGKTPVHISSSKQIDDSKYWKSIEEPSCNSGVSSCNKTQYSALVSSQFAGQSTTKQHRHIMPSLLKSKYSLIESPKTPLTSSFRIQPKSVMSPVEPICNWEPTIRKVSPTSEQIIVPLVRAEGKSSVPSNSELVTNPAVSSTHLSEMGSAKHQSPVVIFNDYVADVDDSDSSFVYNESALHTPSFGSAPSFVRSAKKLSTIAEEHVDRYSKSQESVTKTVIGTCSDVSLPKTFENVLSKVPNIKASPNVTLTEPLTDKHNPACLVDKSEFNKLVKKEAVSIIEEIQSEPNTLVSSDKDEVKLILHNIQSKTKAYMKYVEESEAEIKQNVAYITNILQARRSEAEVYKHYADENIRRILDIVNDSVPKSDSAELNLVAEANSSSILSENKSKAGEEMKDTVKSDADSKLSAGSNTPRRSERLLMNRSAVNMYSNLKLAYSLKTPKSDRKRNNESSQQSPWSLTRRLKAQMKNLFDD